MDAEAKKLKEGLIWLSRNGKEAALLFAAILDVGDDEHLEEALAWLNDIAIGDF